jgi:hypothetical protein
MEFFQEGALAASCMARPTRHKLTRVPVPDPLNLGLGFTCAACPASRGPPHGGRHHPRDKPRRFHEAAAPPLSAKPELHKASPLLVQVA